jgi:membrane protein implicated in regulation of membrane protease activity
MSWELFYLICFVAGFVFSVVSFLGGAFHFHHVNLHIPKHLGGFGHGGHGAMGHAPAGAGHGHAPTSQSHGTGGHFPFFNPLTSAAFLTWFGGTGYLLVHLRHVWIFAGLALSTGAGLLGASVVFWFVAKVLMRNERDLDPLDYEMVGVLGRVSSSIRPGGTGEIIFTQEGVRKACAARCDTGDSLARGVEVVVTRYDGGIAYVRPWAEFTDSADTEKQEQTKE